MNKHETLPEEKGGGHLLYNSEESKPSEQLQRYEHHFFKMLALRHQPRGSTTRALPKHFMISHQEPPHIRLSSPCISNAAQTHSKALLPGRNVWWQRGLEPCWGRVASEEGYGRGKEMLREMAIEPGRSLGNRRKDMSNRKQTYLTLQSLMRLALRAIQFISPSLQMLSIQLHPTLSDSQEQM